MRWTKEEKIDVERQTWVDIRSSSDCSQAVLLPTNPSTLKRWRKSSLTREVFCSLAFLVPSCSRDVSHLKLNNQTSRSILGDQNPGQSRYSQGSVFCCTVNFLWQAVMCPLLRSRRDASSCMGGALERSLFLLGRDSCRFPKTICLRHRKCGTIETLPQVSASHKPPGHRA